MASVSTLDAKQLLRIEAVHRGYLFQHLYAAQCLLCAGVFSANAVVVESDEDVEVLLDGRHLYVQVKYRKSTLAWSDIEGAMSRFAELLGSDDLDVVLTHQTTYAAVPDVQPRLLQLFGHARSTIAL